MIHLPFLEEAKNGLKTLDRLCLSVNYSEVIAAFSFCCEKTTTMENKPPTADALLQHANKEPQVKFHCGIDLHQSPGAGLGINVTKNGQQFGSVNQ